MIFLSIALLIPSILGFNYINPTSFQPNRIISSPAYQPRYDLDQPLRATKKWSPNMVVKSESGRANLVATIKDLFLTFLHAGILEEALFSCSLLIEKLYERGSFRPISSKMPLAVLALMIVNSRMLSPLYHLKPGLKKYEVSFPWPIILIQRAAASTIIFRATGKLFTLPMRFYFLSVALIDSLNAVVTYEHRKLAKILSLLTTISLTLLAVNTFTRKIAFVETTVVALLGLERYIRQVLML